MCSLQANVGQMLELITYVKPSDHVYCFPSVRHAEPRGGDALHKACRGGIIGM